MSVELMHQFFSFAAFPDKQIPQICRSNKISKFLANYHIGNVVLVRSYLLIGIQESIINKTMHCELQLTPCYQLFRIIINFYSFCPKWHVFQTFLITQFGIKCFKFWIKEKSLFGLVFAFNSQSINKASVYTCCNYLRFLIVKLYLFDKPRVQMKIS